MFIFILALEVEKKCKKYAVILFIYGGGNCRGTGTNAVYGPDMFMIQKVVLITFNYRLGPLGWCNFNMNGYTGKNETISYLKYIS